MKRLIGMGLGVAWATVATAAEPAVETSKPANTTQNAGFFPGNKPASLPSYSPASYSSFNGGEVSATVPTPAARSKDVEKRASPTAKPAGKSTSAQAVPVPTAAKSKPIPEVKLAALPVMAPAASPAPAPSPQPVYTALPYPTLSQVQATPPSQPIQQVQATPVVTASPVLAANATGYPVTPTMPATYMTRTSFQAPMPTPTPAPSPAPTPAATPAMAAPPYPVYAGYAPGYGDCGSCQTCEKPGILRRIYNWFTSQPGPKCAPSCLPTPYQAPLLSYFPGKPVTAPYFVSPEPCPPKHQWGGLLQRNRCNDGACSTCGATRNRVFSRSTGCETDSCGSCTPCSPCGGQYPTVLAWWNSKFGMRRQMCDFANYGGYGYPYGYPYGCGTPMAAPSPTPAPMTAPAPMPAPTATPTPMPIHPQPTGSTGPTAAAQPSADWLAGYRFAVATAGRNPMKNTAPTVLPPDVPRMPQPAPQMDTPPHMAGVPHYQPMPYSAKPTNAMPVSVTQPFTNP